MEEIKYQLYINANPLLRCFAQVVSGGDDEETGTSKKGTANQCVPHDLDHLCTLLSDYLFVKVLQKAKRPKGLKKKFECNSWMTKTAFMCINVH